MNSAGITNAQSVTPIIGTTGLATCMAVAVFNPTTKTGGLTHLAQGDDCISLSKSSETALNTLLHTLRTAPSETLEVRMIGPRPAGGLEDHFIKDTLKLLNATPNIAFLSADFKEKTITPSAVGVDARQWNAGLLKGSTTIGSLDGAPEDLAERIKAAHKTW